MNVIITGGSKGIGAALAEALAEKGAALLLVARNEKDLNDFLKQLQEKYAQGVFYIFSADLSIKSETEALAEYAFSVFNQIDVLVNNAGIFKPGALFDEPEGQLESQIQTNLYSAYHLTRAILPSMKTHQSGHIVNMCSIASIKAFANGGSYAISKFALLGFSKCLRHELMSDGIKVTAVIPGATWSNSWLGVELPESRLMQAKDVADMVVASLSLSPSAVVEEMVIRPQLGDL